VTPSETPERPVSSGSTGPDKGREAPPWQKVTKDGIGSDAGSRTSEESEYWSPQGLSGESASYSTTEERYLDANGKPILSGTAVRGASSARSPFDGANRAAAPSPNPKSGRSTPSALRRPGRGPRRASLQVKRFDPWSVLKLSLVLGVAMFFVWLVGVGVLYTVLDGMGVWDKLNGTYTSLVSGEGGTPGDPLISAGRVFGIAAILGAINIVLVSALATVSAFIYNVSADLAGGLEITLSERE